MCSVNNLLINFSSIQFEASPAKHPELAGRGVEYSWGKAKFEFRHNNDYSPIKENLERRVYAALATITTSRSRNFLRKANDYKRAYRILAEQGEEGAVAAAEFADIEKIRKQVREHRCTYDTYDQDYKFIIMS